MRNLVMMSALLVGLLGMVGAAHGEVLAEFSAPGLYALERTGFELGRAAAVEIDVVGRRPREDRGWSLSWGDGGFWGDDSEDVFSVYAWLLDSETRKPVWVMDDDETERYEGNRDLRREVTQLELEPGRYELYFFSGHDEYERWEKDEDYHENRRARREREELEEDLQSCYVRVSSDDAGPVRRFDPDGAVEGALVRFTGLGDGELRRQGFELTRDTNLRVYALMEHPRGADDAADFGWIIDADTGRRVWDMNDRRGRRAGGGDKNRVLDREVSLDAGRYVLCYGTDDSHSLERFNTNPPYDPLNWGITLTGGRDFRPGDFRLFDAPTRNAAVIDFSRARDSDFYEQSFRLKRDGKLHVLALGEGVDGGWTFVDYGWIIDAASGEMVWEMDDRNTAPAGGAEKNRMFDGEIELPAGEYTAFYVTDDSHSWEEWNSGAPFQPEAWGLQIFPANGTQASDIELISADEVKRDAGILARIVRVGDYEREREEFTLDAPTEVEIYALGEGDHDEMYDYGWLRNRDTRRTVWEMEYRDTDHAGGASKNREVRTTLRLEPGTYEVGYRSDDSHSFEGWNASRPDDPLSWGITVRIQR